MFKMFKVLRTSKLPCLPNFSNPPNKSKLISLSGVQFLKKNNDLIKQPDLSLRNHRFQCYSTKANQKLNDEKEEKQQEDFKQEEILTKDKGKENEKERFYKEFENLYNPYMLDIEKINLTEKEKNMYYDFFEKAPIQKQIWLFTKVFFKNIYKLISVEIFHWNLFKNAGKFVEHKDVDLIWKFDDKKDIKNWLILSDAMMQKGYSSVYLDVNKQGRLVFKGCIDADHLPDDGITEYTGFCHLTSPHERSGFGLEGFYNWSQFNHFIIRFKGDGRVYKILLKGPSFNNLQRDATYEYYLYTRGGPYWQVAKIPFSKFILCYQGRIQEKNQWLFSDQIQNFSITVVKYSGPFRLEISHIGLQLDCRHKLLYDYEGYFRPEFPD